MSDSFDAYHQWLGIPPGEQPPNAYRLLGLRPLETNTDVIQNAVDRQVSFLRTYALGEHAESAKRLLDEVDDARRTLLNTEKKAAYDEQLSAQLEPPPGVLDETFVPVKEPQLLRPIPLRPVARRRKKPFLRVVLPAIALILLFIATAMVMKTLLPSKKPPAPGPQAPATTPITDPSDPSGTTPDGQPPIVIKPSEPVKKPPSKPIVIERGGHSG